MNKCIIGALLIRGLAFFNCAFLHLRLYMDTFELWNLNRGCCIALHMYIEIHLYDDILVCNVHL